MQSDPLQTWLTSLSSSVLLVNGQMFSSSPGEQRTSPLSFICAKLIDILVPEPGYHSVPGSSNVFAVYWFCGEHTDGAQDYDAHPLGMMNNIVSQLLTQLSSPESGDLELDLEPVSTLTRLPGSRSQTPFCNDSIEDLCQLFVEIVLSLPEGTILFCIIDGISYYEHPESRRDGLYEVISTFTKLATQIQGGCVFKLLATAPVQTHYVRDLFYETEIYDLKQDLPGVTNFTELNFHESLGREAQRIAR